MTRGQQTELAQLIADSGARLVTKRGWFWSALGWLIQVVTLGRMVHFRHYITTIGNVIAIPADYPRDSVWFLYLLHHEVKHVEQFRRFGLGSHWLGVLPMAIVYLLLPLPMGLAWGRYRLEFAAMVAELKAMQNHDEDERAVLARATAMARQLTDASYAWAWFGPNKIRKRLLGAVGVVQ